MSKIGDFFNWYHDNGIIPNIWKGITGQLSSEKQTEQSLAQSKETSDNALAENARQFNETSQMQKEQYATELNWQKEQFSNQLDFANRNLQSNENIANENLALQRDAYDYQKQLNATQMEREDTAMQRYINDLSSAGLSPLAAIGSNGSSSASLSAGSAPQKDITGIAAAQGQYADFARQYASLHQTATQNFINVHSNTRNSYSQAKLQYAQQRNSEILGARMALSQMKSDAHLKGLNMATQYFNSAVNYKNSKLSNEYLKEQTDYLKDKHNWEKDHGYRGETLSQALISVINKISKNEAIQNLAKEIGLSREAFENAINKWIDKRPTESIGKSLLDSNEISFTEKTALNDAAKSKFDKSLDELDIFELLQVADAATKEEDKLGYKIKNFLKNIFGF